MVPSKKKDRYGELEWKPISRLGGYRTILLGCWPVRDPRQQPLHGSHFPVPSQMILRASPCPLPWWRTLWNRGTDRPPITHHFRASSSPQWQGEFCAWLGQGTDPVPLRGSQLEPPRKHSTFAAILLLSTTLRDGCSEGGSNIEGGAVRVGGSDVVAKRTRKRKGPKGQPRSGKRRPILPILGRPWIDLEQLGMGISGLLEPVQKALQG